MSLTSLKNIKNSRTLTLKTKLTPQEKKELKSIFQTLDPNKFWYLEATIPEPGEKVKSIEERIIQFVLVCNYSLPVRFNLILCIDRVTFFFFLPSRF